MQLIDIGVNLMSSAFDRDREEVLKNAKAAGVHPVIITGSNIESSTQAVHFSCGRGCFATAGVHPHNAKDWNAEAAGHIRFLAAKTETAALGECGLDYNRNFSPQDTQRACFEDQLALAAEMNKPVFLHERDAFKDFYDILKKFSNSLKGAVVHCFTGNAESLEAYLALGCYIGITGWICDERRGRHLHNLLKRIPADRLLLETDAPYLLPRSLSAAEKRRSGRNEPRFLPHIAAFAARILDKQAEQLAAETTANAIRFFNLPALQ
jgi:TatD DNase family protein